MTPEIPNVLRFHEHYLERVWGGKRLRELLCKPVPPEQYVGEAWLISDHASCESIVCEGPWAGKTLNEIITAYPGYVLGSVAHPTASGRFPLLLKLIDAGDALSVQVHPDDRHAALLGESDPGKTEMWHVLHADENAMVTLGFTQPGNCETVRDATLNGTLNRYLNNIPVRKGDSIFVNAGTVHAIGAGVLLAEIQQNSDITYRLYDWNRRDSQGRARELHLEKALEVLHYSPTPLPPQCPVLQEREGVSREILAACRYFVAERITVSQDSRLMLPGSSFHILLALSNALMLQTENDSYTLKCGDAVLLPAMAGAYFLSAPASLLRYYVPDMMRDIVEPLRRHGMAERDVLAFCGQA